MASHLSHTLETVIDQYQGTILLYHICKVIIKTLVDKKKRILFKIVGR